MPAPGLETAHAILRKALREVAPEHRPLPPYHGGGPLLTCPAVDQIRISLWCSELLSNRLKAGEQADMKTIGAMVQKFLASTPRAQDDEKLYQDLRTAGEKARKESAALACMRGAASGASVYMRGKADLVFTSAAASVMRALKELTLDPSPLGPRAFLEALDLRLTLAEMNGAYRDKIKGEPIALERVLYRSGDANGKMALWIGQLEGGSFAFLARLGEPKPKWTWITGSRDHVLASVPDDRFEEATSTLARTLGSSAS